MFVLYTVDLISVIESHRLSVHRYADDRQAYGSCQPTVVNNFMSRLSGCCEAATSWMGSNRLQPNPDKTEVLWCTTSQRQHQLPTRPLVIGGCSVYPAASVRDLGAYVTIPKILYSG